MRKRGFEESQRAIFVVQGNGTLHALDKALSPPSSRKWKEQAELQIALLDEPASKLKLLGYVSDGALPRGRR